MGRLTKKVKEVFEEAQKEKKKLIAVKRKPFEGITEYTLRGIESEREQEKNETREMTEKGQTSLSGFIAE